jgi:hypothetical protein
MRDDRTPRFQILTWQDVKAEVADVNPTLYHIIEEINPKDDIKLIKGHYHFGDEVVFQGKMNWFEEDASISSRVRDEVKSLLSYSQIPLLMTLNQFSEVYIQTNRVIPLNTFSPGEFLGLFEVADYLYGVNDARAIWCVSAGVRSTFMLPKITDETGLRRLRAELGVPLELRSKHLTDHWALFRHIANAPGYESRWSQDILFFPETWFDVNRAGPAWKAFRHHISKCAWQQAKFAVRLGKIEVGLSWEIFTEAVAAKHIKVNPYLSDHIKQLLVMSTYKLPGFVPADDTQQAAPTRHIQQAIIDIYGLKDHLPTIMHAERLVEHASHKSPCYYSLKYPSILEGSPHRKHNTTVMSDTRIIKQVIALFKNCTCENSVVNCDFMQGINFDFYHPDVDKLKDIRFSSEIGVLDKRFTEADERYFPNRSFCYSSPFFKGCVKLRFK